MAEQSILKTPRLMLRCMTQDDLNDLKEILQNPQVMYAYEHAFSDNEVQQWLDNQLRRYREDGFGLWAVIRMEDNAFIGQAGLTLQDYRSEKVVEIGYLFKQNHWHQGYALEAAIGCKAFAFKKLGLEAVYSIIRDNNFASQAVAESHGMEKIDTIVKHYYDIDMPHYIYRVKLDSEAVKQLFMEMDKHLMEDETPSDYLQTLMNRTLFYNAPYHMLSLLARIKQNPIHHPEGDGWEHTKQVVDEAAKRRNQSRNPRAFMWAALLHDIGKLYTTRIRRTGSDTATQITSYHHDTIGAEMAAEFLSYFSLDSDFINEVTAYVRWHMHLIFILKDMKIAEPEAMLKQIPAEEIALLALCDRMGRQNADINTEQKNIDSFLAKLSKYQ